MIHTTTDLRPLVDKDHRIARTLAADRYLDLPAPEDKSEDTAWRARSCERISRGHTKAEAKLVAWHGTAGFLRGVQHLPGETRLLRAKQISRLLVNLGGSAMENGGLSLDRISGLPTIPGSAIKGIARREALLTVRESEVEEEKAIWLANIAESFGWGPDDWAERGDFAQSCGEAWRGAKTAARAMLAEAFAMPPDRLPASYRGRVHFLPAFPETAPAVVSEILTCHHPRYYESIDPSAVALDNEEPRPVVFPAVEKGAVWAFPLREPDATGDSGERLEEVAKFLEAGLRQGIGAKIAAGYGRFESVEPFTDNTSACPSDQVKLTFVTPCMCAGANQQVAEIRVSSLRGELRWWFRALGGSKEQEAEVFGAVAGKSKSSALLLDLATEDTKRTPWITEVRKNKDGKPVVFLQDINADASYLWHFAAVAGAEKQTENRLWLSGRKGGQPRPNATLAPGTSFVLRRSWRRPLAGLTKALFDRAWTAFLYFGAIGLRANRAMGCWMPQRATQDCNAVIADLRIAGFLVTISDREQGDWKDAVSYLGAWMKHDLRKRHPVGKDEKRQIPSPLGSANPRQASAVRFRILKLADNRFLPLALEAPHHRTLATPRPPDSPLLSDPKILQGKAPSPPPSARRW